MQSGFCDPLAHLADGPVHHTESLNWRLLGRIPCKVDRIFKVIHSALLSNDHSMQVEFIGNRPQKIRGRRAVQSEIIRFVRWGNRAVEDRSPSLAERPTQPIAVSWIQSIEMGLKPTEDLPKLALFKCKDCIMCIHVFVLS